MKMIMLVLVFKLQQKQSEYFFSIFSTSQPSDLKKHHAYAMKKLQEKLKPRLLNNVKGDDNNTLVISSSLITNQQTLDIWTGTWNMGECDPPFNLEEWVPNSFDLIAVGVEECMSMLIYMIWYEQNFLIQKCVVMV